MDRVGGDLCEEVASFSIAPMIGDPAFDAMNLSLARAFDPRIIVKLQLDADAAPGRSYSGRARQRKWAAFAECGSNGLLRESTVQFHTNGVLRVAQLLGIIEEAPPLSGGSRALFPATIG